MEFGQLFEQFWIVKLSLLFTMMTWSDWRRLWLAKWPEIFLSPKDTLPKTSPATSLPLRNRPFLSPKRERRFLFLCHQFSGAMLKLQGCNIEVIATKQTAGWSIYPKMWWIVREVSRKCPKHFRFRNYRPICPDDWSLSFCLFKVIFYGFYHGKSPCFTTIWGICLFFCPELWLANTPWFFYLAVPPFLFNNPLEFAQTIEQWKKPWLVGLYRGLYYPVI